MYKQIPRQQHKTNNQIKAPQVRVLDQENKQIGILDISKALDLALGSNLDLIEIAPQAEPPVVKIANYKKFLYQQSKKNQAQVKTAGKGGVKELRFTPFMAEGDLEVRLRRIREFFTDRYKVRLVVKFTGRQMRSLDAGYQQLNKVIEKLGVSAKIEQPAKQVGRQIIMTITSA